MLIPTVCVLINPRRRAALRQLSFENTNKKQKVMKCTRCQVSRRLLDHLELVTQREWTVQSDFRTHTYILYLYMVYNIVLFDMPALSICIRITNVLYCSVRMKFDSILWSLYSFCNENLVSKI